MGPPVATERSEPGSDGDVESEKRSSESSAPSKPPPPRPGGPPKRPSAPPTRPAPPVATDSGENVATTNPNKQNLDSPAIESNKKDEPVKAAGFSDLFCAPPDPDLEADIPISLSSGSLVSMLASGEATPAPTKPPLPHPGSRNASIISLEYPEGYDPLKDSGKCWETGKEQVIPSPTGSSPISPTAPTVPRRTSQPASSSSSSSSSSSNSSGASTPTNSSSRPAPAPPQRPLPSVPSRPPGGGGGPPPGPPPSAPPSQPPPGPPPSRPPPGPPPRIPGRPPGGAPPAVPRR